MANAELKKKKKVFMNTNSLMGVCAFDFGKRCCRDVGLLRNRFVVILMTLIVT